MSYRKGALLLRPYNEDSTLRNGMRVIAEEIPYVTSNWEIGRKPASIVCDIENCNIESRSRLSPGAVKYLYSVRVVQVLERDVTNVFQLQEGRIATLIQDNWTLFEALSNEMEVDDVPVENVIVNNVEAVAVAVAEPPKQTDAFDCVICSDIFTNPCTLRCGHTYCKFCILQWIHTANELVCPSCRAPIQETEHTLSVSVSIQKAISDSVR